MVVLNDNARYEIYKHKLEKAEALEQGLPFDKVQPVDHSAIAFQIAAFALALLNLVELIQQTLHLRMQMLWRFWSYMDLLSICLNVYCSINLYADPDVI